MMGIGLVCHFSNPPKTNMVFVDPSLGQEIEALCSWNHPIFKDGDRQWDGIMMERRFVVVNMPTANQLLIDRVPRGGGSGVG